MILKLVLLALLCVSGLAQQLSCTNEYDVRLVGGSNRYEGRVELCYNGTWNNVCDDYISTGRNTNEGLVVCRQLGCNNGGTVFGSAYYGRGYSYQDIYILNCSSSDSSLSSCHITHSDNGYYYCHHGEDVGVRCIVAGITVNTVLTGNIQTTSFTLSWTLTQPLCSINKNYQIRCTVSGVERVNRVIVSTSTTLYNLQPNTLYSCCVTARDSGSQQCTSGHTKPNPPNRPSGLIRQYHTSSSVLLTWTAPSSDSTREDVQQYNISCTTSTMSHSHTSNQQTTSLRLNVTGLLPHRNYRCCIVAVTVTTNSSPSCTSYFTTLEAAPSSPPNISSSEKLDSSTLYLTWSPPPSQYRNGDIERYIVMVCETDRPGVCVLRNTTTSRLTVNQLHPHYVYSVSVAAYTVGTGPSASISVQMPQDVPSSPPQNLTLIPDTPSQLQLNWSPPPLEQQNGVIRNYTVEIYNQEMNSTVVDQYITSPPFTLHNLHPHYHYTCSVAANTVQGTGPFHNQIVHMPEDAPSTPPLHTSYSIHNPTTLALFWSPPLLENRNGIIRQYSVTIRSDSTQHYYTTDTFLELTDLVPGSTYQWSVAAYTVYTGPYSHPTSVKMPSKVSSLEAGLYSIIVLLCIAVTCVIVAWIVFSYRKTIRNKLSQCHKKKDTTIQSEAIEPMPLDTLSKKKVLFPNNNPVQNDTIADKASMKIVTIPKQDQGMNQDSDTSIDSEDEDLIANQRYKKLSSQPAVPERAYLEDMDFIGRECEMILKAHPDLPERGYLEDVDFVVNEILFKNSQKPTGSEQADDNDYEMSEPVETTPTTPATGVSDGVKTTREGIYQPLIRETAMTSTTSEYALPSVIVKKDASKTLPAETNSTGQYQPLLKKQEPVAYVNVRRTAPRKAQKPHYQPVSRSKHSEIAAKLNAMYSGTS